MTRLPFGTRLVVARVLARYVHQCTDADCNEAVLAALEKWTIVGNGLPAAHEPDQSGAQR